MTEKKILFDSALKGAGIALSKTPTEVIEVVKNSGLRGRGGAGFPTGLKWEIAAKSQGEHYIICNADEGEPGTFKDRLILSTVPLNVIEGIIIASHAVGAKQAYIYLRGEYNYFLPKIRKAIKKARPLMEKIELNLDIVVGQGAYICGEETAILNSIEGHRPEPRKRPPYPAEKGLYGSPTVVNNVETLAMVPLIFLGIFDPKKRLCSLSGDVEKPGVFEILEGKQIGKILEEAKPIGIPKAICFGASGGIMPYDPCMEITEENIKERGCFFGSGTIIIVNHTHSIVELCESIQKFFVHESCGYCMSCREGSKRMLEYIKRISAGKATMKDLNKLEELCNFVSVASFCALGRSMPLHILTALRHFREEFVRKCR
ncbi:MAG: NADH-quinone oxidoreductase subunit F [Candidatus Diapherotrites archaeon]|nr:NADH-quinone oxidoreductase subunit F [Candidatus Diapherotrites archaeon]